MIALINCLLIAGYTDRALSDCIAARVASRRCCHADRRDGPGRLTCEPRADFLRTICGLAIS